MNYSGLVSMTLAVSIVALPVSIEAQSSAARSKLIPQDDSVVMQRSLPPYYVTELDGIRQRVGDGTKVVYAEGCRISEPDSAPNFNTIMPYKAPKEDADQALIKEAVDIATSADVVVLVLGGNEVVSRESIGQAIPGATPSYGDSDTLELAGRQNQLVAEIVKLGKPMVAVLLAAKRVRSRFVRGT